MFVTAYSQILWVSINSFSTIRLGGIGESGKSDAKRNLDMSTSKRAVVLVSGGLDSAVTLASAVDQGFVAYALTFRYGQRHLIEIDAARKVANTLGAEEHSLGGRRRKPWRDRRPVLGRAVHG